VNTLTATVRPGAYVVPADQPNGPARTVIVTPQELRPADGMFVIESDLGYRTFGRLTGRTRRCFGMACPTIERFEVDTVADEDGSLWGDPGQPILGTLATRPDNVAAG
jgi:hypothetical protein